MCRVCRGLGIVEELDAEEPVFSHVIACPAHCEQSKLYVDQFRTNPDEWRPVCNPRFLKDQRVPGSWYVPIIGRRKRGEIFKTMMDFLKSDAIMDLRCK